jgi:dihydroorotase
MPNTKPATTTMDLILRRLDRAEEKRSPVFYGLYVGVTANPDQVKEAVRLHGACFPARHSRTGVVGLKMFAGKSVGDLGITDLRDQERIYRELARAEYNGVLAVHCEREDMIMPNLWNPNFPSTHNYVRSENAEVQAVADQIAFAKKANYKGHLHICHVSSLGSLKIIGDAKREGMRISCGVTPHHLLLDCMMMNADGGVVLKVNPPLRTNETREGLLLSYVLGNIDILESDHAPHTIEEKREKHLSGIPNLASWPYFMGLLYQRGVGLSTIQDTTFTNVNRIFNLNIPWRYCERNSDHRPEYAFDPYASLR